MAQILREGCTYSLIAKESDNENRKVYFVKLTDSCLKAIEEYTDDFLSGSRMKSIIRFDDTNGGAIIIPNSSVKDVKKTFSFAISNVITSDTNPLQECIKCQYKSNQLLSYGPLEQKISIAATADCYENTRNRMAQVEQERNDIRTKEIKLGSMKKGRKTLSKTVVTENHHQNNKNSIKPTPPIRKINPPHRPINPISKPALSSTSNHGSSPVVSGLKTKSPPIKSKESPKLQTTSNFKTKSPPKSTDCPKLQTTSNFKTKSPPKSTDSPKLQTTSNFKTKSPPKSMDSPKLQTASNFKTKSPPKSKDSPKLQTASNFNSPSSTTTPTTAATKDFSCRDRVQHILSLRPHKKPELISRLLREGMTQKDRCSLPMILQQVASYVDHQYILHSNLFAHLHVDTWPFFNENERNIVKQNISGHAGKKSESTSQQVVSSTSKSPPEDIKSTLKRPLPPKPEHVSKKTKIVNNEKPPPVTKESTKENIAVVSSSSDENKPDRQESPQTVASTSDSPEYLTIYKSITSSEQRYQYKRDFQLEYEEYLRIKKYLDATRNKYVELQSLLTRTQDGTPEYNRIRNEILTTYQQNDEKYGKTKCRYDELTKKLSHIKQLVMEYDSCISDS